jgi:hypothetical protein
MLRGHNRTFGQVPPPPQPGRPFEPDEVTKFNWSDRLSIDAIRAHTKTDDIPGVTDEQLELYRQASLEAAEMFTGLLLAGQRTVIEPIEGPPAPKPGRMYYLHTLQYPVADGIVYLYGGSSAADNRAFTVKPGSRTIKVPIATGFIDLSCPCHPCSTGHHLNGGMMAAYRAGFNCPADVPAGVVIGCLQYIAWIVEHPGDELMTQRNRKDNSTKIGGVSGSNNIAMVSGALESWRLYDNEAI